MKNVDKIFDSSLLPLISSLHAKFINNYKITNDLIELIWSIEISGPTIFLKP